MSLVARAPSGGARVWLGALLVFALSCAVLLSVFAYDFFPLQADETSLAWQAKLASEGLVPYRDYFAYKPPLAIYLPAGLYAAVGPSLAALRVFSVISLAATTVLLYLLCVRTRMGVGWAACAALMLPGLMVPFWPVPSGQWVSLPFGLAALLCVAGARPSWRAAFAAGLLVAVAGLCVQTHGALFAGLLALRLVADPVTRNGRVLAAASAGIAAPLLVVVGFLWYVGALEVAFRDVVLWPLRYYKQPGGFNDAAPQAGGEAVGWTAAQLLDVARLLIVFATPWIATVLVALQWYRGQARSRATFAILGCVMLWLVFFRGRTDAVHLVFLVPMFLYLAVHHIEWSPQDTGGRVMRVWLALGVALMTWWPVHWFEAPPSIEAVRAVDARWKAEGVPTLLAALPRVSEDDLSVVFLGAHGASLYFFWSPQSPPVDWLQPPGDRLNSPEEYALVADFVQRHEVPYIVVQGRTVEAWVRDPSPVRDVLTRQYRRAFETEWGTAYCRLDAVAPGSGTAICDLPPQVPPRAVPPPP